MSKTGYRSRTSTQGRNMAGARSLWRATGMTDADFEKPIIAIANSFTQFVPGHVHLHDVGQRVKKVIDAAGGWGVEFNTIAVDDGIAMGHGGMLYSLPSRDLIADSVEYMVNAHCADALVCISNCDKITPGHADGGDAPQHPDHLRLGRPDGGRQDGRDARPRRQAARPQARPHRLDDRVERRQGQSDAELGEMERSACPTCGSCSGMFTANSMNCLNEALGLALPGNGTLLATHARRWELFEAAGKRIVALANRTTSTATRRSSRAASPPSRRSRTPWRSTSPWAARPTPCCTSWPSPTRRASTSRWRTSIASRAGCPTSARSRPRRTTTSRTCTAPGGIFTILGELDRGRAHPPRRQDRARADHGRGASTPTTSAAPTATAEAHQRAAGRAGRRADARSPSRRTSTSPTADADVEKGCIRDVAHAYSKDGGLAVLYGNIAEDGCIVKTAGVDESIWKFEGPARVFHSQEAACDAIIGRPDPRRATWSSSSTKDRRAAPACRRCSTRPRSSRGRASARPARSSPTAASPAAPPGLSIGHVSPEAGEGGAIGLDRGGRSHPHRHPGPPHRRGGRRRHARKAARGDGGARRRRLASQPRPHGLRGAARLRPHDHQRRPRRRARSLAAPLRRRTVQMT